MNQNQYRTSPCTLNTKYLKHFEAKDSKKKSGFQDFSQYNRRSNLFILLFLFLIKKTKQQYHISKDMRNHFNFPNFLFSQLPDVAAALHYILANLYFSATLFKCCCRFTLKQKDGQYFSSRFITLDCKRKKKEKKANHVKCQLQKILEMQSHQP